ncbi:MAG: hypothetical protein ACFB03_12645 [Paracoccaceae bacterium]
MPSDDIDDRELLLKMMACVLIDIRSFAYEEKQMRLFHLADCIHNAPNAIASAWCDGNEPDYGAILLDIERRFQRKGSDRFSELKSQIEART